MSDWWRRRGESARERKIKNKKKPTRIHSSRISLLALSDRISPTRNNRTSTYTTNPTPNHDPRPTTHDPRQVTVAAGVALLRHAVAQVDRAGVFSSNETKDDIATSDLKYVLAPFYLSEVVSHTRTPDPSARLPVVTEAAHNHELFLSTCESHELLSEGHARARQREGPAPKAPATQRAEKVERFRREKAIRARLEELDLMRRKRREQALADADWDDEEPEEVAGPEDEEEERERWLLLIEDAANKVLDAKPHFDMELEMLRNREVRRRRRRVFFGGGRGTFKRLSTYQKL